MKEYTEFKKPSIPINQSNTGFTVQPSRASTNYGARILNNGRPLEITSNKAFQSRLGHDFSQVRIHTSGPAAEMAGALGVPAFTYGCDIAFAPGAYDPASAQSRHILAHELAHVVQQSEGLTTSHISTRDGSYQRLEQDAEQRAARTTPRESGAPRPLPEPVAPAWQCYSVPGGLACNELVDWLNNSSPYAPEWAETRCSYSFNDGVRTTSRTLPDGSVEIRARGHRGSRVSVDCPIDRPRWNPGQRPNRAAEIRAWNDMLTVLNAHESQHRQIGQTWRATLQSRFQAVDFTVTGSDQADATQKATEHINALQVQWQADAQAAQDAIDPFRGAILTCP